MGPPKKDYIVLLLRPLEKKVYNKIHTDVLIRAYYVNQ